MVGYDRWRITETKQSRLAASFKQHFVEKVSFTDNSKVVSCAQFMQENSLALAMNDFFHPPYFQSHQIIAPFSRKKQCFTFENIKLTLTVFSVSKPVVIYALEITSLPIEYEFVIDNERQYIND